MTIDMIQNYALVILAVWVSVLVYRSFRGEPPR